MSWVVPRAPSTQAHMAAVERLSEPCNVPDHTSCQCHIRPSATAQSLEEMDFLKSACAAAATGNMQRLECLLQRRPEVINSDGTVTGLTGYTPLHYAARAGNLEVCQLLLRKGASVDSATVAGKTTPLHRAGFTGHVPVLKLLLEHGANSLLQDADGETALHKAAAQGHVAAAVLLASASPEALQMNDRHGLTPTVCATGAVVKALQGA